MVSPLSAYSMMLAARNPWDKGPMEAAKAYIEQENQAQSSEALQQLLAGNTGSIGALDPSLQGVFLKGQMDLMTQDAAEKRKMAIINAVLGGGLDGGQQTAGGMPGALPAPSPSGNMPPPITQPSQQPSPQSGGLSRAEKLTALSGAFPELAPMATMARDDEKWKRENDPTNVAAKTKAQEEGKKSAELEPSARAVLNVTAKMRKKLKSIPSWETGPIMGKLSPLWSGDSQVMRSMQNQLALQAKSLLALPSNNFSDADREYLDQIAGGMQVKKEALPEILDYFDELAYGALGQKPPMTGGENGQQDMDIQEGQTIVNPNTGERMIMKDGAWHSL